jgi:hypothetical protein
MSAVARIQAVALQARYHPVLISCALAADMLGTRYEPLISRLSATPQPRPGPRSSWRKLVINGPIW